ncbi:hypothetical protein CDV36_016150 [Fusarium kuroshium]|uniref:Uncharacterized protein n=1 Tax=Fusarium kuroshium TaxID=2010991 RepID=A0A3M2QZE7_9HYPO|nr:hypothetical protein CDV36_016150 [Fusarium kuroshium]
MSAPLAARPARCHREQNLHAALPAIESVAELTVRRLPDTERDQPCCTLNVTKSKSSTSLVRAILYNCILHSLLYRLDQELKIFESGRRMLYLLQRNKNIRAINRATLDVDVCVKSTQLTHLGQGLRIQSCRAC